MQFNEIIRMFKELFPEKAIDISECLGLLLDTIDSAIIEIDNASGECYSKRDFNRIKIYTDLAEHISVLEKQILETKDLLEPEDVQEIDDEADEIEERKTTNYGDYVVDNNVEHTLYESFTHKKPCSFEIQGAKIEARTWQEVFIETCKILMDRNKDLFIQFAEDPKMNGKKVKYFSLNPDGMRKPERLRGLDVYVETNMSANGRRNLMVKMLQKFSIRVNEYKVYFRADYTGLHE